MAFIRGVSKRTIENRMAEYHMTNIDRYSDIDDGMFQSFVPRIIANFQRSGKCNVMMSRNRFYIT